MMSREELKSDTPWYFQPRSYALNTRVCQAIEFGILDHMEGKEGMSKSDAINELLAKALNLNQKKQNGGSI
jgi:hypothetical protein